MRPGDWIYEIKLTVTAPWRCEAATKQLRPSDLFRPMATACTTWQAAVARSAWPYPVNSPDAGADVHAIRLVISGGPHYALWGMNASEVLVEREGIYQDP
jgi:hypothetical protein